MDLPRYERIWLNVGIGSLIVFLIVLGMLAFGLGLNPSDSMEITSAPEKVESSPPFDAPGVYQVGPKEYHVVMVSFMYGYNPGTIEIPVGSTVRFQATSKDVVHGLYVAKTNVNMMLVPGHVSEYRHTFDEPGEYLFLCHEYCGIGHQVMQGRIIVTETS